MMCPTCKYAGVTFIQVGSAKLAREMHSLCEYPKTCTCQHMCVSMIQKRTDG